MTYKDFFQNIKSYYGAYRPGVAKIVLRYVQQTFLEEQLTELFQDTVKYHSMKWKSPPDVAIFEEVSKNYRKIFCKECGSPDQYHYIGCSKMKLIPGLGNVKKNTGGSP